MAVVTRTAAFQGIVSLRVDVGGTLPDAALFGTQRSSSYGKRKIMGGLNIDGASPPNISGGEAATITTAGSTITGVVAPLDPLGDLVLGYGFLGDYGMTIPTLIDFPTGEYWAAIAHIPDAGGVTVSAPTYDFFVPSHTATMFRIIPQPMLRANVLRSAWIVDPAPLSGLISTVDPSGPNISTNQLWGGFDASTTLYHMTQVAMKPADDGTSNFILLSGFDLQLHTAPLLIHADSSTGTEPGDRYEIHIDAEPWESLLQQISPARSYQLIQSNNAGWYTPLKIDQVTTPTVLQFNEDMTKVWAYVMTGNSQPAIDTIFWAFFGVTANFRMFLDVAGDSAPGAVTMVLNTADTSSPLHNNIIRSVAAASRLLPPYPPILRLPCVPCAPMQMDGDRWRGRFA